jgi:hypothetical protein
MTDYQIQPNTRQCAATGRVLRSGERYFSVLVEQQGKLVRLDYGADAWHGPPDRAFGFWAGRIPTEEGHRPPIDDEMLLDCFGRLEGQDELARVNFRYVVALLLMRRKRLRFEEARTEGEVELLVLRCPKTRTSYRVINPRLGEDEMAAVQDEVFKVLGWD